MTRLAKRRVALAVLAALFMTNQAAAQGIFDIFGDDRPARSRESGRSRGAAREERKKPPKAKKRETAKPGPAAPAATEATKTTPGGPEAPPPPYEPQLTRLTEVLGALSFLRDLCGAGDGDDWRAKMAALLDAEAPSGPRRERLTASFNRGFRGFELTYRVCTPNAKAAIARFLDEASKTSLDITYRYGSP